MPSHGSLTKAGKVRSQTPKIEKKPSKNLPPRVRNKMEYEKRNKNKSKGQEEAQQVTQATS
jgi:small subunit ribosomal protein S30e